jgi:hypothetical protein
MCPGTAPLSLRAPRRLVWKGTCTCLPENPGGKNRLHSKWREKVGNLHAPARKYWRETTGFTLSGKKKLGTCTRLPDNSGGKARLLSKWREKVGNLQASARKSWRERTSFTLSGGKKLGTCTCLYKKIKKTWQKEPVSGGKKWGTCTCLPENPGGKEPVSL